MRDDSPFFFQMTRWKSVKLDALKKFGGAGFLEPLAIPVAQIALLSALIISLVLSVVMIALPLVIKKGARFRASAAARGWSTSCASVWRTSSSKWS